MKLCTKLNAQLKYILVLICQRICNFGQPCHSHTCISKISPSLSSLALWRWWSRYMFWMGGKITQKINCLIGTACVTRLAVPSVNYRFANLLPGKNSKHIHRKKSDSRKRPSGASSLHHLLCSTDYRSVDHKHVSIHLLLTDLLPILAVYSKHQLLFRQNIIFRDLFWIFLLLVWGHVLLFFAVKKKKKCIYYFFC